jgi:hypothetical protein
VPGFDNQTDHLGIPVIRVTHRPGENKVTAGNSLDPRPDEMLKAAGAIEPGADQEARIWQYPHWPQRHHRGGGPLRPQLRIAQPRWFGGIARPGELRSPPHRDDRGAGVVLGGLPRTKPQRSGSVIYVSQ